MTAFLPDTSCMVAAVCSWHEHHAKALAEIQDRLNKRQKMIVAAPALIETYSVLTRLPAPHRISPTDALSLLEANFLRGRKVTALSAAGYGRLLRDSPENGISGGRIYDAVIAACASKERVVALLTFNETHFASLTRTDLQIVAPG
jgi:predicted nucleic acid-binding protein